LRERAFLLAKMTEGVILSTKTPPVKSSAFDSPLGDGAVVVLSYFSPINSNLNSKTAVVHYCGFLILLR